MLESLDYGAMDGSYYGYHLQIILAVSALIIILVYDCHPATDITQLTPLLALLYNSLQKSGDIVLASGSEQR